MAIDIFAGIVEPCQEWGRSCQFALSYNLERSTKAFDVACKRQGDTRKPNVAHEVAPQELLQRQGVAVAIPFACWKPRSANGLAAPFGLGTVEIPVAHRSRQPALGSFPAASIVAA